MARYFFDTDNGTFRHEDEDGQLVADLDAARRLALSCLIDMGRDKARAGDDCQQLDVDVRDETGKVVYKARLSLLAQQIACVILAGIVVVAVDVAAVL